MKNQNSPQKFSIWHYKPWWCQPWSIILTGMIIIGSSWLLWHVFWLSILIAFPIILWWSYFLLLYPRIAQDMIEKGSS